MKHTHYGLQLTAGEGVCRSPDSNRSWRRHLWRGLACQRCGYAIKKVGR